VENFQKFFSPNDDNDDETGSIEIKKIMDALHSSEIIGQSIKDLELRLYFSAENLKKILKKRSIIVLTKKQALRDLNRLKLALVLEIESAIKVADIDIKVYQEKLMLSNLEILYLHEATRFINTPGADYPQYFLDYVVEETRKFLQEMIDKVLKIKQFLERDLIEAKKEQNIIFFRGVPFIGYKSREQMEPYLKVYEDAVREDWDSTIEYSHFVDRLIKKSIQELQNYADSIKVESSFKTSDEYRYQKTLAKYKPKIDRNDDKDVVISKSFGVIPYHSNLSTNAPLLLEEMKKSVSFSSVFLMIKMVLSAGKKLQNHIKVQKEKINEFILNPAMILFELSFYDSAVLSLQILKKEIKRDIEKNDIYHNIYLILLKKVKLYLKTYKKLKVDFLTYSEEQEINSSLATLLELLERINKLSKINQYRKLIVKPIIMVIENNFKSEQRNQDLKEKEKKKKIKLQEELNDLLEIDDRLILGTRLRKYFAYAV